MQAQRTFFLYSMLLATLTLVACGDSDQAEPIAIESAPAVDESAAAPAALPRTASPRGAGVFFIIPADGDVVSSPVQVELGVDSMTVVKSGDATPESGHHHIIVDAELPDLGLPIPANDNYIHFGDGSTSAQLELAPGTHTLQLLLGDYLHIPHKPPVMSAVVTITVE